MANARLDLQDLIENPLEVLDVELKDWTSLEIAPCRRISHGMLLRLQTTAAVIFFLASATTW
jgi:hypothetical protein